MKKISIAAPLAIALALICGAALAAPTSTATAKTKKPGLLSKILHHGKGTTKTTGKGAAKGSAMPPGTGSIIGDKNTKVYHLPSDKYMLPAEKNRVYFKTEAQAKAAGYHHAGAKAGGSKTSKKSGHKLTGAKILPGKVTAKKSTASHKGGKTSKAKH